MGAHAGEVGVALTQAEKRASIVGHGPTGNRERSKEGSFLPEGSGDEQSPELVDDVGEGRALQVYEERMAVFEQGLARMPRNSYRKRRRFSDYTVKNCEEASGRS